MPGKHRSPAMQLEVMTPTETAEFLRCSLSYVHKAARAGNIPVHRLGTDLRFIRTELLAWLANDRTTDQEPTAPPVPADPKPTAKLTRIARAQAKAAVVRALTTGTTYGGAAKAAGVSAMTVRTWRGADPEFQAACEKAVKTASEDVPFRLE